MPRPLLLLFYVGSGGLYYCRLFLRMVYQEDARPANESIVPSSMSRKVAIRVEERRGRERVELG